MKQIILGTDWWTDCDDAVALRLLARAHQNGEIRLLGIGINACMEDSVASMEGFLNTEGVTNIPLGIDLAATDYGGEPPYQKRLTRYAKKYRSNLEAEDAVRLYRRLLAESDEPVEIVEIGFLQVVADLLESPADDLSPKSGRELVAEKVKKMWVMAGRWDVEVGRENNFCRNRRAAHAGERFCHLCPVPVTFLGWELGTLVVTGGQLGEGDPLRDVLCDFGSPEGRKSWDPMLSLLAVIGDEDTAGYDTVRGIARVDGTGGENRFTETPDGLHRYLKMKHPPAYYEDWINERIRTL